MRRDLRDKEMVFVESVSIKAQTLDAIFTDETPESSSHSLSVDPISYNLRHIYQVVGFVIICGLLSLIGIGTNIINIIVFVKQGFKESINISLLGLSVADLACVVTMFWSTICYNPLFLDSDLPFDPMEVMYLTGGYPHACFNRVTSFITTFITLERCLCITFPLKVKNIITPLRTKIIMILIFIVICIVFSPFYFVNSLEWQFNLFRNKTTLQLTYARDRVTVETIIFPVHSVCMSTLSLVLVIVCTVILIVSLNRKAKWRQSSVAKTVHKCDTSTVKEKRVVRMVTFISVIFIFCFIPGTLCFFAMAYEPQFNFNGEYANTFLVIWTSTFILETFNSSVNMFIYLKMSSKFKITFITTFCCCAS